MKILLALLFLSLPAYAQFTHKQQTGTIAASTTCPGNGCVTINSTGAATAFVTISAINGGTYGFFCSNDSWVTTKAVLAYAYTAATGVVATSSVITTTTNGDWVLTLPACQYFGVVATIQGTTATVRIDLDSVKFAGSSSASSGGTASGLTAQVDYATVKRWGGAAPTSTIATTLTAWGMAAPVILSPGGAAGANVQYGRSQIFLSTTAATNSAAGIDGPYSETRTSFGPILYMTSFGPAQSNSRVWFTIASVSCGGIALSAGPTAQGTVYVGIGWQQGFNSNDWNVCSGDGTNMTCTDTGVAVSFSTKLLRIKVDWSNQASLVATLWDTNIGASDAWTQEFSVTKTTNLSVSSTQDLGVCYQVTALENAAKNAYVSSIHLQQNN